MTLLLYCRRLLAYPRGVRNNGYDYFSVYLDLAPGLYPPGWRREVNYRITLVNVWPQSNKVLGNAHSFISFYLFCDPYRLSYI